MTAYSLTGSPTYTMGTIIASNQANLAKNSYLFGGGDGTFNSNNVTPALTAPSTAATTFWVTVVPSNAAIGTYRTGGSEMQVSKLEITQ